jgi:hypothetical protein
LTKRGRRALIDWRASPPEENDDLRGMALLKLECFEFWRGPDHVSALMDQPPGHACRSLNVDKLKRAS